MDEKDDSSNITGMNEDLDTTPPNPASEAIPAPTAAQPQLGKWEMPKPVFRQTSGQLPENFEKRYGRSDDPAATPAPEMESGPELPPVVEEQPELAEVLIPEPEIAIEHSRRTIKAEPPAWFHAFRICGHIDILAVF